MATGNTKYGDGALENNTVNTSPDGANNNSAFGIAALKNSTEYWNTAVGAYSGIATTTGISNTSVGTNTLLENIDGSYNTALGTATLCFNTSGSNNTAVGSNAMENNTRGSNNTCIGSNANVSSNNLNFFIYFQLKQLIIKRRPLYTRTIFRLGFQLCIAHFFFPVRFLICS